MFVFLSVLHIRFLFIGQNYILKEEVVRNKYLFCSKFLLFDETRKLLQNEGA